MKKILCVVLSVCCSVAVFSQESQIVLGSSKVLGEEVAPDDSESAPPQPVHEEDEHVAPQSSKMQESSPAPTPLHKFRELFTLLKIHPQMSQEQITKRIEDFQKDCRAQKTHSLLKRRTLSIVSIRVGQDHPFRERVGKGQVLPVMITVQSPQKYTLGRLKVYARHVQNKTRHLIYTLKHFQLNKHWAQDQFIWDGSSYQNGRKKSLAPGRYDILVTVEVLDRKAKKTLRTIHRRWGHKMKKYSVRVE